MGLWELTLSTPSSPGFSQLAVEKGEELGFVIALQPDLESEMVPSWMPWWPFPDLCDGHILQLFLHCLDRVAELQDKRAKLAVLNRHGLRDGSFLFCVHIDGPSGQLHL